jgi:hypothetical protein
MRAIAAGAGAPSRPLAAAADQVGRITGALCPSQGGRRCAAGALSNAGYVVESSYQSIEAARGCG